MEITVFGTPVCPNCTKTKQYLDSMSVSYEYKTIGKDVQKSAVDSIVGYSVRSVPVIVVDGQVSSFDDLKQRLTTEQALNTIEL